MSTVKPLYRTQYLPSKCVVHYSTFVYLIRSTVKLLYRTQHLPQNLW